jgi:hypothetical protein
MDTRKEFSEKLGEREIETESESISRNTGKAAKEDSEGGNKSKSYSVASRPLLPPNQLLDLNPGEIYVYAFGFHPLHSQVTHFWKVLKSGLIKLPKMPEEYVEEFRDEGLHVHHAIQEWINTGDSGSIHPGVAWVIKSLEERTGLSAEVLVSDLKRYASAVDIVNDLGHGELAIFDIKTGKMKRRYVTTQLNIYRYLIDHYTKYHVGGMICISIKDHEFWDIMPMADDQIEKLLYGGK